MEENNNFSWMELVFGTGTNCQFCGVVTLEQHKDSCPAKLININWATQTLFANLQGYENFDELDNPELNEVIGRQLMMIADAILHMQREWSTRLLTDQAEEVLNNWSMISQFCEALVDADVLRSKKSVLKFVKNPTKYNTLYMIWQELEFPMKEDPDTAMEWQIFKDRCQDYGYTSGVVNFENKDK